MAAIAALLRLLISRLATWLPALAAWALELVRKLPVIKFGLVVGIVVAVVAAIPWPSWIAGIGGLFAALPPGLVWGLELLKLPEGLAIMSSAWGLRFMLRWIRAAVSAA